MAPRPSRFDKKPKSAREKDAAARNASSAQAMSSRGGPLVPINLMLPKIYMQILGAEADGLGLKRGAFLSLLLQRKRGMVDIARGKQAPKYTCSEAELREAERWIWYIDANLRKILEADCLQMGLSSITSWVTQALNDWIGKPKGLLT